MQTRTARIRHITDFKHKYGCLLNTVYYAQFKVWSVGHSTTAEPSVQIGRNSLLIRVPQLPLLKFPFPFQFPNYTMSLPILKEFPRGKWEGGSPIPDVDF